MTLGFFEPNVASTSNGTSTKAPPPPDKGLAELIGIGPEAAADFGKTRIPPGVQAYDETVTSERIIAVDVVPSKLALARTFGATHTLNGRDVASIPEAVRELTEGRGADYAFEAIGVERTIREAWEAVRPGGTVVVIGLPPKGSTLTIDTWGFINEKTLKGCLLGSAKIEVDIPRIIDLYHAGELKLDELVSRRIHLSELPEALERLRSGEAVRQLVVFDSAVG